MKGILLAGGKGTRLYPVTKQISKHLLPIYDKPLIYYSLSTLMLLGVRDILLITTPEAQGQYMELLGNGENFGIKIVYKEQDKPNGIAEAFLIADSFIDDTVCLLLGDNIFYGIDYYRLKKFVQFGNWAKILALYHDTPCEFGVLNFSEDGSIRKIEEKPLVPKSNYIVPGIYFYNSSVVSFVQNICTSNRGELEITDINNLYLKHNNLSVKFFNNVTWFDTGTVKSMYDAAQFVAKTQNASGNYIGCPEQIAYEQGFIDRNKLMENADHYGKTEYREYLLKVARQAV